MDADEIDICNYLKSWPKQFISGREISRRAGGKRRFQDDPYWATRIFPRMVEKGILEADASGGHYRLPLEQKDERPKKWVSPQIKKILEASGKDFDGVFEADEPEGEGPFKR